MLDAPIELYSRYTDAKQRLFVVVNRWKNPLTETPTCITLLNVFEEKTQDIEHSKMLDFINKKQLTRIL